MGITQRQRLVRPDTVTSLHLAWGSIPIGYLTLVLALGPFAYNTKLIDLFQMQKGCALTPWPAVSALGPYEQQEWTNASIRSMANLVPQ